MHPALDCRALTPCSPAYGIIAVTYNARSSLLRPCLLLPASSVGSVRRNFAPPVACLRRGVGCEVRAYVCSLAACLRHSAEEAQTSSPTVPAAILLPHHAARRAALCLCRQSLSRPGCLRRQACATSRRARGRLLRSPTWVTPSGRCAGASAVRRRPSPSVCQRSSKALVPPRAEVVGVCAHVLRSYT
jgi:hypothetical protein